LGVGNGRCCCVIYGCTRNSRAQTHNMVPFPVFCSCCFQVHCALHDGAGMAKQTPVRLFKTRASYCTNGSSDPFCLALPLPDLLLRGTTSANRSFESKASGFQISRRGRRSSISALFERGSRAGWLRPQGCKWKATEHGSTSRQNIMTLPVLLSDWVVDTLGSVPDSLGCA
jgi:hypothetical protein